MAVSLPSKVSAPVDPGVGVVPVNDRFPLLSLPGDLLRLFFESNKYLNNADKFVCKRVCHRVRSLCVFDPAQSRNNPNWFLKSAVKLGYLALVQWDFAKFRRWASQQGLIRDLLINRLDLISNEAASEGQMSILQWTQDQGSTNNNGICFNAIRGGHINVLMFAIERGMLKEEKVCEEAACSGQLQVLQWAIANGMPWGSACPLAAVHGHLNILTWARENGAPWNEQVIFDTARACDQQHVVDWLLYGDQNHP